MACVPVRQCTLGVALMDMPEVSPRCDFFLWQASFALFPEAGCEYPCEIMGFAMDTGKELSRLDPLELIVRKRLEMQVGGQCEFSASCEEVRNQ